MRLHVRLFMRAAATWSRTSSEIGRLIENRRL